MIRKAVIPAAGLGTRFLPFAKSLPKGMLPIVDIPVIQFVVQEAVDAGITDIIIVTGENQSTIEEHFRHNREYEEAIANKGRLSQLTGLLRLSLFANIQFVRQPIPKGLGDAVLCARSLIGNEPFAVLLGDTLMESSPSILSRLIADHERFKGSSLAIEEVPMERAGRYAVIKGELLEDDLYRIQGIVEKPYQESAPSNLAVAARYIFTPDIFDYLKKSEAGYGGEIQLTDAIAALAKKTSVHAVHVRGKRYDIGDRLGFVTANVEFALRRPELRASLIAYMEEALLRYESKLTVSAS